MKEKCPPISPSFHQYFFWSMLNNKINPESQSLYSSSPSVVKISTHLECMLPLKCWTMTAMLFDSLFAPSMQYLFQELFDCPLGPFLRMVKLLHYDRKIIAHLRLLPLSTFLFPPTIYIPFQNRLKQRKA